MAISAGLTAVIGGTGLSQLYAGERAGDRETPYGRTSADIISGRLNQRRSLFLARHGNPHTIAPHKVNYRANLWALKELAVSRIIAVNAVGGINPTMPPESIVIPDQLIDYSYGREQSFFDGLLQPLDHIDFSQPFSPACCQDIAQAAKVQSIAIHRGGVYGVTQGPRLETVAEINRMAIDGCDMVGMTAMPEAALARELGIDYASICLVVNPAAGRAAGVISMADIHAVIERGMLNVKRLLLEVIG